MKLLLIQVIIFIVVCCQAISATLAPVTDLTKKRLQKRFLLKLKPEVIERIRAEAAKKRVRDAFKRLAEIAAAKKQKKG